MSSQLSLQVVATAQEIRRRIDAIQKTRIRNCLRLQYLTASRIAEIAGPRGIKGKDCQLTSYQQHPVAVFSIKTAKARNRVKASAIPLEAQFEPWTQSLVDYFKTIQPEQPAFNLSTRQIQKDAKQVFKGLSYEIEEYWDEGEAIPGHSTNLCTHGLRHIRITELTMHYGFDELDLTIFAGWSFKRGILPGVASRYLHRQWSRYFPKLLKPLPS